MKNSTTAACPKSADAPKHYILHHNQSMRAIASHGNSPNTIPSVTNITFDGPAGLVPARRYRPDRNRCCRNGTGVEIHSAGSGKARRRASDRRAADLGFLGNYCFLLIPFSGDWV